MKNILFYTTINLRKNFLTNLYNLLKIGNTCINKVFKEDYMRKGLRIKNNEEKSLSDKIIMYSSIGVGILVVIIIGMLMYSKSLSDDVKNSALSLEQIAGISDEDNIEDTESVSTEIGKTVEEVEDELDSSVNNETNTANTENASNTNNLVADNTTSSVNNTSTQNTTKTTSSQNTTKTTNATNTTSNTTNSGTSKETKTEEAKVELSFSMPVDGEIVREFAKDNLIYSETLQEWVTHTGIDIKAEKTTVVKAAEAGTVKSIKNDPRYGLTIVIEHEGNFQTVYSNLLTSEFVVEGEKVEKGQSIGTVGNTAVFEIADEPHLHFEIIKDSIQVDPSIYLK